MIVLITATLLLGLITYLFHVRDLRKQAQNGMNAPTENLEEKKEEPSQECCGQHLVCERDSLLAGVSKEIEYYDDEELDEWKGVAPDAYTTEQVDHFREIFYTLQANDVAGWVRSLQLREIAIPEELRDEILLIINDQRTTHA